MSDPRVSDMSLADLDDVERIAAQGFRPPWTRAHFVEELGRAVSRCRVLRARDGGPAIGYAISWIVAGEQTLLSIAVDPAHRRAGVAHALLEDLLEEGARRGAAECFLEVRPGNEAAVALYRAHGFEVHDVRPRYYDDGEDGWIMRRA